MVLGQIVLEFSVFVLCKIIKQQVSIFVLYKIIKLQVKRKEYKILYCHINMINALHKKQQKQSFADVLLNRCSYKF